MNEAGQALDCTRWASQDYRGQCSMSAALCRTRRRMKIPQLHGCGPLRNVSARSEPSRHEGNPAAILRLRFCGHKVNPVPLASTQRGRWLPMLGNDRSASAHTKSQGRESKKYPHWSPLRGLMCLLWPPGGCNRNHRIVKTYICRPRSFCTEFSLSFSGGNAPVSAQAASPLVGLHGRR
jgi:hypothetical protein